MGVRLLEGRRITADDTAQSRPVVVVSEQFARDVFGDQRALGQQVRFFSSRPGGTPPPSREVVGIVSDVRHDGVTRTAVPQMYVPYAQASWSFVSFSCAPTSLRNLWPQSFHAS
jgi:hypothetical protein